MAFPAQPAGVLKWLHAAGLNNYSVLLEIIHKGSGKEAYPNICEKAPEIELKLKERVIPIVGKADAAENLLDFMVEKQRRYIGYIK